MTDSKFKVLDEPINSPGKCAACGVSHGGGQRQFVDISLDLDWYGVVYFCTTCLTEIANELGYASPEQYSTSLNFNKLISDTNEEIEKENDELRRLVATLSSHNCRNVDVPLLAPDSKPGKEVPKKQVVSGGTPNAADVKSDAGKGPSDPVGVKSSSNSDLLKELGL